MSQLVPVEAEDGDPVVVPGEDVPGVAERIGVPHEMRLTGGRVPFHAEDGNLPVTASRYVRDKDGVAVGALPPGGVHEHVTGADVLQCPLLCLLEDGGCVAGPIDFLQVAFQMLPVVSASVGVLLSVHAGEAEFMEASPAPKELSADTHGHIGALFAVAEGHPVDNPCGKPLESGRAAREEPDLGAAPFQGEVTKESGVCRIPAGKTFVSCRDGDVPYSACVPRIADKAGVPSQRGQEERQYGEEDNLCLSGHIGHC